MATLVHPLARLRQQSGMVLTELMIASSILIVVLTATLSVIDAAVLQAPQDQERAQVIRSAQAGVYRMTRELRHATAINGTPTASSLDVNVTVLGTTRRVRYRCDQAHPTATGFYRCVREVITGGTVGPAATVIDKVSSTAVFAYTPNTPSAASARHVEAKITLPAKGERSGGYTDSFVLSDGTLLRNR